MLIINRFKFEVFGIILGIGIDMYICVFYISLYMYKYVKVLFLFLYNDFMNIYVNKVFWGSDF